MGIFKKYEKSLIEQDSLSQKKGKKKPSKKDKETPKVDQEVKEKKLNFIASTWRELKQTSWASPKYTAVWSGIVILFVIFLALFINFFDHVFGSSVKYISCTSDVVQESKEADKASDFSLKKEIQTCSKKLLDDLTFQSEEAFDQQDGSDLDVDWEADPSLDFDNSDFEILPDEDALETNQE